MVLVLIPEVAWGQQVELEKVLEAQRDEDAWKKVVDCKGAESYLEERPEGLFAKEARKCLEAIADEEDMRRMKRYEEGAYKALERGNVAGAKRRLEELRKLAGKAPEVMDLEDAIDEAEEKSGKMREYAKTGREAVGRGDLEKAGRYVERMRGLDAGSSLVVELEEAIADAEAERKAVERRQAEAERKEREAEERRRRVQSPGTKLRDCPECPEMVVVPSGRFMMGSRSGVDDELPVHEVAIARPFAVGVYEVTFEEWDACVSGGRCGGYRPDDRGWGRGNRPVINVSWDDAQAYVGWLSGKTGEAYRLLSEAEWEYVARAGTRTRYWWGDDVGRNRANCEDCGDSYEYTAPVGSFSANPFGLYDVHGNVWEWVEDCWNGGYRGAPSDGSAWKSGNCGRRVVRGGSWVGLPGSLRSAYRSGFVTGSRIIGSGFRVARTLTP